MCNLYSVTKGQRAIRDATRALVDRTAPRRPRRASIPITPLDLTQKRDRRELTVAAILRRWA